MKKLIYSGLLIFMLLCLLALYQSGYPARTGVQGANLELNSGESGVDRALVGTAFVDQVAVAALSQPLGGSQSKIGITSDGSESAIQSLEIDKSLFGLSSVGGSATGRVVPRVEALLSMMQSGNVIQIYIEEGDFVALGDVLLQLDDSMQKAAVAEAKAELSRAQAELAKLQSPTRVEEVQAAEAALDSAKAGLRRLEESTMPGRLAIAEASLTAAQAQRTQAIAGPNQATVLAANAELEGAKLFLEQAQRAYDQVSWRNDVGLLPESLNLQDATVRYNAALAKGQAALTGATDAEVSGASANVQRIEAEMAMLQSSLPAEQAALKAEVRFYESRLALLAAGPLQADIDAATAQVEAAQARLDSSAAQLTNTALSAPFSGTIAMIEPSVGERIEVGAPIVRLADLTSWQIETADLSELDLANLVLGGRSKIRFDAIPDLELTGIVKSIRPFGENDDGDTYYQAIILPDQLDDRLRWNMTAFATFEPIHSQ